MRVVVDLTNGNRVVATTRTKGLEHVESVSVDVVQVTAVVNDGNRFVKGLSKDAFRIVEDGVPQTISHFSNEGSPLELVVAVDVSQSMAPHMPQLKNAVRRFLAALGPKDQVTLAAFNDHLFTLARRETVPAQRAARRGSPGALGRHGALRRHRPRRAAALSAAGRRVLVVFSDGDDRTSHATIANVEAAMRSTDATLFMVALGRGSREAQLRSGIQRLITLSGGRGLFVERSDRLDEAFAEIVVELSNQYSHRVSVHEHQAGRIVARNRGGHARFRPHRSGPAGLSRAGRAVGDAADLASGPVCPSSAPSARDLPSASSTLGPRRNRHPRNPVPSSRRGPSWCSWT